MAGLMILTTDAILQNARMKAEQMGRLRNSIMGGTGNIDGFIGENAVKTFLHIPLTLDQNTYDYDLIWQGLTIDVKSKKTSVIPSREFECSVAAYNTRQRCTHYVFTRVYYPAKSVHPHSTYIMGYLAKAEYYARARFLRRGEIDGTNGFVVREDCWNLLYSDLKPITFLVRKCG